MITMNEYAKRRRQLMQKLAVNDIVIICSAQECIRNNDSHYPFRQNSDFYYLTGFTEPDAIAVITRQQFILFNRTRDRSEEIWNGYRAGQEGARKKYGADQAFPTAEFAKKLPELLSHKETLHIQLGLDAQFDRVIYQTLKRLHSKIRHGLQAPLAIKDVSLLIHDMRLIKSPAEIKLMRLAAKISAKAHCRAMQYCKPQQKEYELEAEIMHEFQRHGARFPAYNTIVGSGSNSCILHYTNNDRIIKNGDLVLIDAGAEYEYYAADITRTFPANGKFSAEQKAIYEIVLAAQLAGIQAIRPGTPWPTAQHKIVKIITEGLLDLGLLKGRLNTLIEKNAYADFYMHKSGHWLGLDVHDVGRYKIGDKWRTLQPGMVLTVEPGIYISRDIPGIHSRWHNIGVRIEDDVLVTKQGNEVLSLDAPKSIDDIEAIMT